ncbi:venom metalloproteinase antarease-like TtrivMP_A isoform X2 [Rhipicephalus sanguineus]|uniref:venom metalloproteinase antarease-like TtrivMP_A isoform X2 n=1 Tax=Rhipicephalus sanguineus TaxID=34632 RepID=UPI0020C453F3|nr:venom metalloproteinase antarease-like TtrivMP_A isoform X2 [Rhipicephalus sanguineus]
MVMQMHDQLTLNLRKASVAAPTLRLITEEKGKTVTHYYNGEHVERDLYEDADKIASVIVTKDHFGVHVKGLVGPRHRIEPMPVVKRSGDGLVPHAIHEIEFEEMMDSALRHTETEKKPNISERQVLWPVPPPVPPGTVYVEIFVVSDQHHHKSFASNDAFLGYLCVMFNSANLRFAATSAPTIVLLLVGAERSQTLEFVDVYTPNPKYAHDQRTLAKLRTYANQKKALYGNPDAVYYMSGFDMYSDAANTLAYGVGYISGVCTALFVALGEDKAGLYTGTHGMTHELAHVLGAPHDGDAPPTVGHPGSQSCLWDNGNLMSYVDKGPNHHQFSACSLRGMQYVITLAGFACWQTSKAGYKLDDVFPGMVVDLQAFCKEAIQERDATIESATVIEKTCKVQCMYYKLQLMTASGYNYYQRMRYYKLVNALDYTACAAKKVCIQGVCVNKPPPKQTTVPPATVATSKKPSAIPTLKPAKTTAGECVCDCTSTPPTRTVQGR